MSRTRLVAVALLVLAAAGLLAASLATRQPPVTGEDEITYVSLNPKTLKPGSGLDQRVPVQGAGLSQAEFLYYLDAPRPALIHVTWSTPDATVFDRETIALDPTPSVKGVRAWFALVYWGIVARYATIPVRGAPPGGVIVLHVELDPASPPITVYLNPPEHNLGPSRLAVRTRYGASRPLPALLPQVVERIGTLAPPWLSGPLPGLLALVMIVLGIALAAGVALSNPD